MVSCADYRSEQRLLALKRILAKDELPESEREALLAEVRELEDSLGMGD